MVDKELIERLQQDRRLWRNTLTAETARLEGFKQDREALLKTTDYIPTDQLIRDYDRWIESTQKTVDEVTNAWNSARHRLAKARRKIREERYKQAKLNTGLHEWLTKRSKKPKNISSMSTKG